MELCRDPRQPLSLGPQSHGLVRAFLQAHTENQYAELNTETKMSCPCFTPDAVTFAIVQHNETVMHKWWSSLQLRQTSARSVKHNLCHLWQVCVVVNDRLNGFSGCVHQCKHHVDTQRVLWNREERVARSVRSIAQCIQQCCIVQIM